jgi:hypothetical protein
MKHLLGNLKWFVSGFALLALIIGAITVLPAIGQGSTTNDYRSDGSAEDVARVEGPSNLSNDLADAASQQRTESSQELAFSPANAGTTNLADVPDGQTEGGVEEGIELATNVQVIGAADFINDGIAPDGFFFSFWDGSLLADSPSTCMAAPVNPPDASSIYQFWATVYDNDTNNDIWLSLLRMDNYSNSVDEMASLSSGDSVNLQQLSDSSIDFPLVAYPDYSYFIGTCTHGSTIKLISARVWWTP